MIQLPANQTSYTDVSLDPKENYVTSAHSNNVTAARLGSGALEIDEPQLENVRFEFTFLTEQGELYMVEVSTTLGRNSRIPAAFAQMPNESAELQTFHGSGDRKSMYVTSAILSGAFIGSRSSSP